MNYDQWKYGASKDWKTAPISPTCDCSFASGECPLVTVAAHPAMGGGWCALCATHALKHPEAFDVHELIRRGEKWEGCEQIGE